MQNSQIKELREALLGCHNAREVARRFGLPPHKVYYFAKSRKIQLRSTGRPQSYQYDEDKLIPKIKRALGKKGKLLSLSKRLKLPYHILTNISKKLKKDI
jgi:hypothetical protein